MSRLLTTLAVACGALVLATSAARRTRSSASPTTAASTTTTAARGSSRELAAAGLTTNKMTVNWDPARPTEIVEKPFLDRSIPKAEALGIPLARDPHRQGPRDHGSPQALDQFTAWLQKLAWTYPQVTEYVVGNEPNLTRFWQPQYDNAGRGISGIAFAGFLARSYDALKEVNPKLTVVGVGSRRAVTTSTKARATSTRRSRSSASSGSATGGWRGTSR